MFPTSIRILTSDTGRDSTLRRTVKKGSVQILMAIAGLLFTLGLLR